MVNSNQVNNQDNSDDASYVSGSQVPSYSNSQLSKSTKKQRVYDEITKPRSSLPLLIIQYFNLLYSVFFLVCVIILFIYKGMTLPYPPGSIGPEVAGFIFFMVIQFYRLKLTKSGNKSEQLFDLVISALLSIPVLMGYIFLIRLQTYVLSFDLGLNLFGLIYTGLEVLLLLHAMLKFSKSD